MLRVFLRTYYRVVKFVSIEMKGFSKKTMRTILVHVHRAVNLCEMLSATVTIFEINHAILNIYRI